MNITNKDLKKRIVDISFDKGLSHLGSCLTAVDIIKDIYDRKKEQDIFILSSGHAALALYVVLEQKYGYNAARLFNLHGVHPNHDLEHKIHASTGSLGHGLGIALGYAIANKDIDVYCLISDGECAEGSVWEALRVAHELELPNLRIYLNDNGYGAYKKTDGELLHNLLKKHLSKVLIVPYKTDCSYIPFLQGLDAHYFVMSKDDYKLATQILDGNT